MACLIREVSQKRFMLVYTRSIANITSILSKADELENQYPPPLHKKYHKINRRLLTTFLSVEQSHKYLK